MSNYLVTGGCGFVGSHLTDLLIQEGHNVSVVDNLSTGKLKNLNPEANFYKKDITDKVFWKYLERYDAVFHTAALARIQPSIKDPVPAHSVNINGTLNILEYCRKHNTKLIFSASSSVYKGDSLPTKETDAIEPKSPYALQKYVCEQYIDLYHKLYDLDYTILRYFNVYGERQLTEGAYCTVLGIFLKQKKDGKVLTITGDGTQKRSFTHVSDVAKANLMALGWQGTFNIGVDYNTSINEIAGMVGGKKEYIEKRRGEVMETLADNSKALAEGWKPTVDIEDWIQRNV